MKNSALTAAAVIVLACVLLYNGKNGAPARAERSESLAVEVCQENNAVKAALRDYIIEQIDRSQRSLPTIEYYQNHPVELGKALANIRAQRDDTRTAFAPKPC